MEKHWILYPQVTEDLREQLLTNRSIEEKNTFLSPLLSNLNDSTKIFHDLPLAVERIKKAIVEKELIYVYGDYDVDGITASAILWETIDYLGGKVMPYIPSRHSEGYGIHQEALKQIAKEGAKIVISVDCGITAVEQAELAKELKIDLIITDHHQPQDELPKPFALLHSTSLSGSGVALRLAENLLLSFNKEKEEQFYKNLELAALGTVADMVPLLNDNRIIVANGIPLLSKTNRIGLKALYEEAGIGKYISTFEIGFVISPRLNSTGRMENALDSLRLLLTRDQKRAYKLAQKLSNTNKLRQEQTKMVFEDAKKQIENSLIDRKFLVVHSSDYPEGVVGLVASRIVDFFYKPAAVIGKGEKFFKGSARSISNFDITKAIHSQEKLLVAHGGHPMAAGFSIEEKNIFQFQKNLEEIAESEISNEDLKPKIKIDKEISLSQINNSLMEIIKEFAPFGVGNSEPLFLTRNLMIADLKRVGKESQHLRLTLKDKENNFLLGVLFDASTKSFNRGDIVEIVYNIRENTWNNKKTFEARIKDLKKLA